MNETALNSSAGENEMRSFNPPVSFSNAIADVKWWYRQQLGMTFQMRRGVEVVRATQPASWFGGGNESQHFTRALQQVHDAHHGQVARLARRQK